MNKTITIENGKEGINPTIWNTKPRKNKVKTLTDQFLSLRLVAI
jgi:hypothetical protein